MKIFPKLKRGVFLKAFDGKWALWDYINHKQYFLDKPHFAFLFDLVSSPSALSPSDWDGPIGTNLKKFSLIEYSNEDQDAGWGWDELSHVFHKGTMDVQDPWIDKSSEDFIDEYLKFSNEIYGDFSDEPLLQDSDKCIRLAELNLSYLKNSTLLDALLKRKTTREFKEKSQVSFDEFSTIIRAGLGPVHGPDPELESLGIEKYSEKKFTPSPGNIHPEEFFIQINGVEGIGPGLYYYHQKHQSLIYVNNHLSDGELKDIFYGQFFHENCSFLIFIVSRFDKLWWKYKHSRAYRMANISVGSIVQNFQVINNSMGLQSWMTGHYHDTSLVDLLKLPRFCYPMFVLASGAGFDRSIPTRILQRL